MWRYLPYRSPVRRGSRLIPPPRKGAPRGAPRARPDASARPANRVRTKPRPAPNAAATFAGPLVVLKPGREKSLRQRHPWIFSGAIDHVLDEPVGGSASGATVGIASHEGELLAIGAYSPVSQIRVRVWSFAPATHVAAPFFVQRVEHAITDRKPMFDAQHSAARLVHGESDGLPGVIADRYGDVIVVQLLAAGADRWRDTLAGALADSSGANCVFERSDAEVRGLEGLPPRIGPLIGTLPAEVVIREDGLVYGVDVQAGQKTGFYLDQRDNRRRIRECAAGRRVLNAFCYTGGFTLAALAGGAHEVLSIDSSGDAIALARANLARNPSLDATRATWREADVFTALRELRNEGAPFDLIVLDPPKFAPTAAHAERASRAYKDINLLALKLLTPGGLLATFSCSGGISADLFQKIVAGAAVDAQVEAQIVQRLTASADHPVALAFPEGDYLKGLLIRKS